MSTQNAYNQGFASCYHRIQTIEEFIAWGRSMGIEPPKTKPNPKVDDEEDFMEWLKKK